MSQKHTLIVGGGIIGACSAWYLTKAGRQVTIVDKGDFGAACSHGNCGYVSPSHVLPLPKSGQLSVGLKSFFKKSALKIRPGLSLSLWRWLIQFAMKCNDLDAAVGGKARHTLLQSSRRLYDELIETESLACEWKKDGLLFVFRDQKEFEYFGETNDLLKREYGVPAEPVSGDALTKLEPALKPGLAGAWHYHGDAHLRPDQLMSELRRRLVEFGVEIVTETEVLGFESQEDRVSAVKTSSGKISADEFVVATGAVTPFLNRHLRCRLPIQPGKGISLTMPRPKTCPRYPMLLEEVHVGITPFEQGYRIGSTMELAGYNSEISDERIQYVRAGAAEYLHDPYCDPVEEKWFGWRPMTPDGVPYIDRAPAFGNVWIAAGHNMLGLSMGTGTGKLVSELITGTMPHITPSPYRIGRA